MEKKWKIGKIVVRIIMQKYRVRKTLNLPTCADSSTNTIKKEQKYTRKKFTSLSVLVAKGVDRQQQTTDEHHNLKTESA